MQVIRATDSARSCVLATVNDTLDQNVRRWCSCSCCCARAVRERRGADLGTGVCFTHSSAARNGAHLDQCGGIGWSGDTSECLRLPPNDDHNTVLRVADALNSLRCGVCLYSPQPILLAMHSGSQSAYDGPNYHAPPYQCTRGADNYRSRHPAASCDRVRQGFGAKVCLERPNVPSRGVRDASSAVARGTKLTRDFRANSYWVGLMGYSTTNMNQAFADIAKAGGTTVRTWWVLGADDASAVKC